MVQLLTIAQWNSNGLVNHRHEVEAFVQNNNIDILLISETHFTEVSYFKLRVYDIYSTNYPNGAARGGSAVIIKHHIGHYEIQKYCSEYIQATNIVVEDWAGPVTIFAAYCPSRHRPNLESLDEYFKSLGNRFLAGGDFNAKHPH